MASPFKPFKQLGGQPKAFGEPPRKPRGVKTTLPKTPNYLKIKSEVWAAIENLPSNEKVMIPPAATLPEAIVGLCLCWLNYQFQAQRPEDGGRLRIGGAVVDYLVYFGATRIVIRVQGDYWHSLPIRKMKDIVQAERLRQRGLRVIDFYEHELYQKWVEGGVKEFVDNGIKSAA